MVHSRKRLNSEFELQTKIENIIKNAFPLAVSNYGFADAYERILRYRGVQHYDVASIIRSYMTRIRNMENSQIGMLDVYGKTHDIIYNLEANNEITVFVLYKLFEAINSNTIISMELKYDALHHYFDELCRFSGASRNKEAQCTTILYCIKYSVLDKPDSSSMKKIYTLVLDSLYRENNHYIPDESYIVTIASLFRGIFFYAEYEAETIRKTYRDKIRVVFLCLYLCFCPRNILVLGKDKTHIHLPNKTKMQIVIFFVMSM